MQMSVSYVSQAKVMHTVDQNIAAKVTQCKQKYMADTTEMKIRKFRFLFQVHS